MDFQDFIKVEHESPINSSSKEMNFFMTHFYDVESQDHIKSEYVRYELQNDLEIIERLEESIDLRTTKIEEILACARADQAICQEIDWLQLKKKIMQKKIALKRSHAKAKKHFPQLKKEYFVFTNSDQVEDERQDIQSELKKKRNRMSAQISRDRRKVKIQELECYNSELKREADKVKQENERLKRQLEDFNKFEEAKSEHCKANKNKFFSLLIMLGVLFLLSIFKDSTSSKAHEVSIPNPMNKAKTEINGICGEQLISKSQQAFVELEEQEQPLLGSKKSLGSILEYLEKMKEQVKGAQVPQMFRRQLESVKGNLF